MRTIKKGAASQSLYFEVLDSASTTGGRKTGLAYDTASLTAYYSRNGASATAITLATLAAANSSWSSGGFKEVDATNMPGLYRLDVPDAAFASGTESVVVTIRGAAGMVQASYDVQLADNTAADVYARLGAPVGASISADVAMVKVDTAAVKVQTDKITFTVANQVDVNVLDWKSSAAPAMTGDAYARIGAAGAGLTALGDTRIAHLDADVSTRSIYAGADTAGTTTLLARLTAIRAGLLDHLDADVSSRLAGGAYIAPDNAGIASIEAKTENLPSDPADQSAIIAATDAIMTRIGAPVGVDISADIAAKATQTSVDDLPTNAELTTALGTADDAVLAAIAALTIPTAAANAAALLAAAYEGSETVQDFLRLLRAVSYGKANALNGATAHYRDAADTKNRVTATVDPDAGTRIPTALDAT
ncbi:hypothetical protein [Mesorhizobium sp. B2-4-6]|uniref:hypothetical protein n=1 Tax=Mesorhizobium sp. B2-4-6 TaxID=2589943 RepID=UPI001128A8CA|nr:hypothetical protein [Mesorhizobium sp. B2-4-6]TPL40689.1 hypothetical protein FJ957_26015 [Mesorhizobium sp. B2-4-6]